MSPPTLWREVLTMLIITSRNWFTPDVSEVSRGLKVSEVPKRGKGLVTKV